MKQIKLLPFVALAALSCTQPEQAEEPAGEAPTTEEAGRQETSTTGVDVEALIALEQTVVNAFKAGEIDPMAALYPVDVVLMPPNEPALEGKEAALEWIQGLYDAFSIDEFTSPLEDVQVSGDMGVSRGTFSWSLTPKAGGDPVVDNGKFVVLWRREPDGWKRTVVIWNSDNPPFGGN